MTGVDQTRLVSMVAENAVSGWLGRFHREGGVIAGTSAGASAMNATMLVSGDSDASGRTDAVAMGQGLGLIADTIIDQHFAVRGPIGRLIATIASAPVGQLRQGDPRERATTLERRGAELSGRC